MRTAKIGPDLRLGVLSVSNKDDARKAIVAIRDVPGYSE